MTVVHTELGYLEPDYLTTEYTSLTRAGAQGSQATIVIGDSAAVASQVEVVVADASAPLGGQGEVGIADYPVPLGVQGAIGIADYPTPLGGQGEVGITDYLAPLAGQVELAIDASAPLAGQVEVTAAGLSSLGSQYSSEISAVDANISQFNSRIDSGMGVLAGQAESQISASTPLAGQSEAIIEMLAPLAANSELAIAAASGMGSEAEVLVSGGASQGSQSEVAPVGGASSGAQCEILTQQPTALGGEYYRNTVMHRWAGYLVQDYAVGDYLVPAFLAHLPAQADVIARGQYDLAAQWLGAIEASTPLAGQFEAVIDKRFPLASQWAGTINAKDPIAAQFQAVIFAKKKLASQFEAAIQKLVPVGAEFESVFGTPLGSQVRIALYNTTQLRVLWEFPSRGDGTSWTANTTAAGDFAADNLNTDVVEQVWRGGTGAKTGVRLDCDTSLPQGVYLDTLAILNHNLTRSANILVQGSNVSDFSSIGSSFLVTNIVGENAYYIAPTLPNEGFRYWRIAIDDATNPNNYLQIGTIVFGAATIMTTQECFVNPIKFKRTHYLDTVETEGYTTVGNDRGVKKSFTLDFQALNFQGGNYEALQDIFDGVRTSHKALWIPTPQYPSRYAVFGKLLDLPEETHTDNGENADYVDLTISVDEAK